MAGQSTAGNPTAGKPTVAQPSREGPSLGEVLREWGRLGCIGFGGPPAHMALLRELCVQRRGWLTGEEFEDGIAACNLLPGPASTQLAIFCAWWVRGWRGALVGGVAFIAPGLAAILALAALFLEGSPPVWVRGAAAGAGAAVAAVAVRTGWMLLAASRQRAGREAGGGAGIRLWVYLLVGGVAAATVGPWLVVALIGCGVVEIAWRGAGSRWGGALSVSALPALPAALAALAPAVLNRAALTRAALAPAVLTRGSLNRAAVTRAALIPAAALPAVGGVGALVWVAMKVGALSFGGGFVIVPLMQHNAVSTYHWMTAGQFVGAVALGQVTPGPLVQTVAVVGYAAGGVGGGLLAAGVAFAPSFVFVMGGARHFDRLRTNVYARSFLGGAGPAAIGAILGSAVPLGMALSEPWQAGVLGAAAIALLVARRGVVGTLLAASAVGALVALAGAPLPS
jgi:chromate transporter